MPQSTKIWYKTEADDHARAFYRFCKRQGDEIWTVTHPDGDIMILLNKNGTEK